MPVPEERLYNPGRLNRWFAISSVLMMVSSIWFVYVDYERPWRGFQDEYFLGKAALAHLDYLSAITQDKEEVIAKAEAELASAKELLELTAASRLATLKGEYAHADLEFKKANAPFSRTEQVLEVTKDSYERELGAHGPDHAKTIAAHEQFQKEEDALEAMRKDKENWEDEKRRIERELRAIQDPVRVAEKKLTDLKQVAIDAMAKDRDYRGLLDKPILGDLPVVSTIINFPLVDFTAPKNTPGRHQINQLVLPEVRQRLNYLETYTTDRCTTCHIAIDDPEFSKDRLARKLERSLPGINEALQRMGEQPMSPPIVAGLKLPEGPVTDHWDELSREQQGTYFESLLDKVNSYLTRSGRKAIELGQPVLAHPDLDFYVDIDSPHPMVKMGCTVCHEGNPQETDFVQAAHSPPTHELEEQWADEYYLYALGVPNVTFDTIDHYWDRPMRLPQHTEAGCSKCHTKIADIARFRGDRKGQRVNLGQHLFREVGCINCHNVDDLKGSRRVGPELTNVASKLTPAFVQQWAWAPQRFRPSTRMPHFFMQENNREQSANEVDPQPTLRTQTEVAAISQYLFAVSKEWEPIAIPDGVMGDTERGRELFKKTGCLACHSNVAEFGEKWITEDLVQREGISDETALYRFKGMTSEQRVRYAMDHFSTQLDTFFYPDTVRFDPDADYNAPAFSRFAPELTGIGSKVNVEWLYSWLMEPTHYSPETKMPSLRLTPQEAVDLVVYLMSLTNDEFEQKEFSTEGEAATMADDLMFMLLASQRSERRSHAVMRDEGGELTDSLVALLKESEAIGEKRAKSLVGAMSLQDKKLTYLGSKMIGHYGCYACHKIPGFETTSPPGTDLSKWAERPIAQLDFAFYDHAFHGMREEKEEVFSYIYPRDADELNHNSPIDDRAKEQITHTHAAFAKHKMLNPRIWDREKIKKPYDKLKMPNFYFSEEEAEALTTYLLSRIPPRVTDALAVDYEGDPMGPIAEGRLLTRELNCVGCHQIEDNAPMIQQYFRREVSGSLVFDVSNAPPLLWGEGAKVQPSWFHRFLGQVEPLRPWLQVRMPSFNLTSEQSTTLVEYFAALNQDESRTIKEWIAPIEEYRATAGDDAPWYEQEQLEVQTEELRRFGIERKLLRPASVDPHENSGSRLARAHAQLLERTEFLQGLYDVQYPFVEPPAPLSPPDRYARGERLFTDMGCLKCHVLGDMLPGPAKTTDDFVQMYRLDGVRGVGDDAVAILNGKPFPVGAVIDGHTIVSATADQTGDGDTIAIVEGPNATGETERIMLVTPTAPNLGLTQQRLQRKWVHAWMLGPRFIQPGTKMPLNFADGISPYLGDDRHPGTSEDHINLLVDYLYDAGAKNVRAPLLKIVAPSEDEGFDEDGGDFDDEGFDD